MRSSALAAEEIRRPEREGVHQAGRAVDAVEIVLMIERRARERLPASLPARIAFGGRYRLRGVVLNVSEVGAKLVLDRPAEVPANFVLSVCYKSQERHYRANVRWRRREVLGVSLRTQLAAEGEGLHGLAKARGSEYAVIDERRLRLFHFGGDSRSSRTMQKRGLADHR